MTETFNEWGELMPTPPPTKAVTTTSTRAPRVRTGRMVEVVNRATGEITMQRVMDTPNNNTIEAEKNRLRRFTSKPAKGTNGKTAYSVQREIDKTPGLTARYRSVVRTHSSFQRECAHEWRSKGIDNDTCKLCNAEHWLLPLDKRIDGIYTVGRKDGKLRVIPPHDGIVTHEGAMALTQPKPTAKAQPAKTAMALPNSYGYNVKRPPHG